MLDIVQSIIEWLIPIFLPNDQVASGEAEQKPSPLINSHDSNSPDPVANTLANGLSGAHFLMVAFVVVAVWLIISNLTTRVVDQKRSFFRENKSSGPFGLPLDGIIDNDSDRHIWQENVPVDLKFKWILEKHEAELNNLQRQQIEQDIKVFRLSRKISRRERPERPDTHVRYLHRRRPDISLREGNRAPAAYASSEEEIKTLEKYAINENPCRCVKTAKVASEKRETGRKGNGDEIIEERYVKDEYVSTPLNTFGQGDAGHEDQLEIGLRHSVSPARWSDTGTRRRVFFASTMKNVETNPKYDAVPPTPPPRPELPRLRAKPPRDNGFHDSMVDRFNARHPESECAESTSPGPRVQEPLSLGGSCAAGAVNADASQTETAPDPKSPILVDSVSPDCAT